ncbi:MAG: glycosyl hydrolase family 28 protein [Candidatus Brocadiia bacterium]
MSGYCYDVTDFGALVDASAVCTQAVQEAIDACHRHGGGVVLVPAGEYVTGTLQLRSHVNLHLLPGARLRGSTNLEDYRAVRSGGWRRGLIFAENAEDVSITGAGEINGSGSEFMDWDRYRDTPDYDAAFTRQGAGFPSPQGMTGDGPVDFDGRPGMLIVLVDCENVAVRNVTLADSPVWTMRIGSCDDVRVSGITIRNNLAVANSDGVHVTGSRNVRISDCDLRCGDDAVCVTGFDNAPWRSDADADLSARRGYHDGPSENVVVTNCVLRSRSSGVRIGYGARGVRDCVVQNLTIYDSNRGLGVFARDAGSIENILFSNVTIRTRLMDGNWWGKGEPIHVSAVPREGQDELGRIRNVRFRDVIAQGEAGIVLYGSAGSPLEDIALEGVQVTVSPGEQSSRFGGNFDLRPAARMEQAIFRHDIPGIYAQHADRLALRRCSVRWDGEPPSYCSHALELRNVRELSLEDFRGRHAFPQTDEPAVLLDDVTRAGGRD